MSRFALWHLYLFFINPSFGFCIKLNLSEKLVRFKLVTMYEELPDFVNNNL